jgi:hypothetical protein
MSDERPKALLKLPVKELVKAGPKAPFVLVRHVIESEGPRLSVEADGHRRSSGFVVEEYVDRLITRQLMLVRGQGGLAGLAMVGTEAAATAEVVAAPLSGIPKVLFVTRWQPGAGPGRGHGQHLVW